MRVEQLREEFPLDVEWWPYELRPGTPPEGIPLERIVGGGGYTSQYLAYVEEAAAQAGIRMKRRALLPNSRPSLEAAEFAREAGRFEPLHRALFRAYFEEGEDIGDEKVLARLAGECGLDAGALVAALRERRYEKLVDEKVRWAYEQNLGGVPAFIFCPAAPGKRTASSCWGPRSTTSSRTSRSASCAATAPRRTRMPAPDP